MPRKSKQYFSDYDSYLFHQGKNYEIYKKMGAHPCTEGGKAGVHFTLWAPNARNSAVITEKNNWSADDGRMKKTENGIWELFLPNVEIGDVYRFVVEGADGVVRFKSDPYAFASELRPNNGSVVTKLTGFRWSDSQYIENHDNTNALENPMAIYEVHLGSWKKNYGLNEDGFLNYRTLADQLSEYLEYMNFTHVELIGISEHPFDGSWGYQVSGFYSPTSRYGSPNDFRYFVNKLHKSGIGVILDWVPAHFPKDTFSLENFDGTPLYEFADPLRAEYPEWGTKAFDHSKPEVRNFLIANALYWINEFHIDALRVDAVAAMLYNSFAREKWRPNEAGGEHNLESTAFLRELNQTVTENSRGFMIAEDSSIEPKITSPVSEGGLGFLLKWNMGWMNDTLKYIKKDPIYRKWHHYNLTHSIEYAFLENYVLVLSHDEVVHLKKPMVEKFPGSQPDKFGGLKTLYTYQFTHPGKKLVFMGQEFAQTSEWSESREIDWWLADMAGHRDVMESLKNLIAIYRKYPVLYFDSKEPSSFEWINSGDCYRNTVSYIRRNPWNYNSALVVVCNFSPEQYDNYRLGVPKAGAYKRIFSTFDTLPGGGGPNELGGEPKIRATMQECDGRKYSLTYNLRPYESVIFEIPFVQKKTAKEK